MKGLVFGLGWFSFISFCVMDEAHLKMAQIIFLHISLGEGQAHGYFYTRYCTGSRDVITSRETKLVFLLTDSHFTDREGD